MSNKKDKTKGKNSLGKRKRKRTLVGFFVFLFASFFSCLDPLYSYTYHQVLHSFVFSHFLPSKLSLCFFFSFLPPPPSCLCVCLHHSENLFCRLCNHMYILSRSPCPQNLQHAQLIPLHPFPTSSLRPLHPSALQRYF